MRAKIYQADVPNVNGVVYPADELKAAVERFNTLDNVVIADKYPPDNGFDPDLEKAVGTAFLDYDGGFVVADVDFFDNDLSKEVMEVKEEYGLRLMPCAVGEFDGTSVSDMSIVMLTVVPSNHVNVGENKSGLFELD